MRYAITNCDHDPQLDDRRRCRSSTHETRCTEVSTQEDSLYSSLLQLACTNWIVSVYLHWFSGAITPMPRSLDPYKRQPDLRLDSRNTGLSFPQDQSNDPVCRLPSEVGASCTFETCIRRSCDRLINGQWMPWTRRRFRAVRRQTPLSPKKPMATSRQTPPRSFQVAGSETGGVAIMFPQNARCRPWFLQYAWKIEAMPPMYRLSSGHVYHRRRLVLASYSIELNHN